MEQFRAYLLASIDELDRLEDHPDPSEPQWRRAGDIAAEAGDRAARLGLSALHQASLDFGLFADPIQVKTFLASCLAACKADKPEADTLSLAEAASLLGCSESGLRKLVQKRAIQFSQRGKHAPIKFRREWLDDYLDNHSIEPGAPSRQPKSKRGRPAPLPTDGFHGFDASLLPDRIP